jgi:hypothetical protein
MTQPHKCSIEKVHWSGDKLRPTDLLVYQKSHTGNFSDTQKVQKDLTIENNLSYKEVIGEDKD